MAVYNSIKINELKNNQTLYLVRYSHVGYPDYIKVYFECLNGSDCLSYRTKKGRVKKITINKAKFRLFSDVHEMARSLYDCFIKREVDLHSGYSQLFLDSQDNRPEIWI